MKTQELLGFTAGNFDLLHPGYINCFKEAKRHCDKFIIFLQIDDSLHRNSKYKPVISIKFTYSQYFKISIVHKSGYISFACFIKRASSHQNSP